MVVLPPFTAIRSVQTLIDGDKLLLGYGAQDLSPHPSGAYTGDISGPMLAKLGCSYVVVGHSERRAAPPRGRRGGGGEGRARRTRTTWCPILCVGEQEDVREAGGHVPHCLDQLDAAVGGLPAEQARRIVLAYEPVWAIGTGKVATPDDAQEICAELRTRLAERYSGDLADGVRILYGGSVKAANAAEILARPDVDGALVGGASLDGDEFARICRRRPVAGRPPADRRAAHRAHRGRRSRRWCWPARSAPAAVRGETAVDPSAVRGLDTGSTGVRQPSARPGGTLRLVSGTVDSLDPARSYSPGVWNVMRLYTRQLVAYAPRPGAEGTRVVPDLATAPGRTTDGGRTWTYTLRPGVRWEDGSPLTSADVKYGIERLFASDVITGGPTWAVQLLDDRSAPYDGPYLDKRTGRPGLRSVTHAGPADGRVQAGPAVRGLGRRAGAAGGQPGAAAGGHRGHVRPPKPLSLGPYRVARSRRTAPSRSSATATGPAPLDPVRTALPDRVELRPNVLPAERDRRVLAGAGGRRRDRQRAAAGGRGRGCSPTRCWPAGWTTRAPARSASSRCRPGCRRSPTCTAGGRCSTRWTRRRSRRRSAAPTRRRWRPRCGRAGCPATRPPRRTRPARATAATWPPPAPSWPAAAGRPASPPPSAPSTTGAARWPPTRSPGRCAGSASRSTVKEYPRGSFLPAVAGSPAAVRADGLGLVVAEWAADFPSPYAFLVPLVDGRSIRPSGEPERRRAGRRRAGAGDRRGGGDPGPGAGDGGLAGRGGDRDEVGRVRPAGRGPGGAASAARGSATPTCTPPTAATTWSRSASSRASGVTPVDRTRS